MDGAVPVVLGAFASAFVALFSEASARADTMEAVVLDYALQCQGCHLASGQGGGDIPSLHGVGRLAQFPGGREYLARVPGVTNASIDDARLARLLTWVLERWSSDDLPGDFTAYQAAEITNWRTPLPNPAAARAGLTADP